MKLKSFCTAKETINWVKRQTTDGRQLLLLIYSRMYSGVLDSFPLIYVSIFEIMSCDFCNYGLVVYFEVRYRNILRTVLFRPGWFWLLRVFCAVTWTLESCFYFGEEWHWSFGGDYITSVSCSWKQPFHSISFADPWL